MADAPLAATGCNFCKDNHYKCDRALPSCRRCSRAKRRCIRRRIWVPLPRIVDFVDETQETVREYRGESLQPGSPASTLSRPFEPPTSAQPARSRNEVSTLPTPPNSEGSLSAIELQRTSLWKDSTPHITSSASQVKRTSQLASSVPPPPSTRPFEFRGLSAVAFNNPSGAAGAGLLDSSVSRGPIGWPLTSALEALLIRNFVDNVAHFFDFADRHRRFAIDVPQYARMNYTLSRAMLALSARHLSLVSNFDTYVANRYQHQCLQSLIPLLDEPTHLADESLLAALVILRLLEELDVSIAGSDKHEHLLGTQAIISTQQQHTLASGLREAAFWAAFRQEIYVSSMTHRPPRLHVDSAILEHSFGPTDDWVWSRRSTAHCGNVLQFAYGPESTSVYRFQKLLEDNERWNNERPGSFDPLYQGAHNEINDMFPDLRFQAEWHAMGLQYHLLAHLLLVIHDPGIPKSGPTHRSAIRKAEAAMRADVCALCGIGYSNTHAPAAMIIACLGIALCGDRFTEYKDQKRLHDVLMHTEEIVGWPTSTIRAQLKQSWEWGD